MVKDPVCGMEIEARLASATRDYLGQTHYFCSEQCAVAFDAAPGKYTLMELPAKPKESVVDPVCGMVIDPESASATRTLNGENFYFCSTRCTETFDAGQALIGNSHKPITGSPTTGFNPNLARPLHIELPIAGLTCSTCVSTVERSLQAVSGVDEVQVIFALGRAQVTYDPERVGASDLASTVKKVGYDVGTAKMRVRIDPGLYCASCVSFTEEALNDVPGILRCHSTIWAAVVVMLSSLSTSWRGGRG